jgi:hypothetical protein
VALDAVKKKELVVCKKFRLEQATAENLSHHRTCRINQRLQVDNLMCALDFGTDPDPRRVAELEQCRTADPGGSRPAAGMQQPEQPWATAPPTREVDPITNLPLFSTIMDNVIAIQATVTDLNPAAEGAQQINYIKALVTKAVEQQQAHCDS